MFSLFLLSKYCVFSIILDIVDRLEGMINEVYVLE